jgi:TonB family protein
MHITNKVLGSIRSMLRSLTIALAASAVLIPTFAAAQPADEPPATPVATGVVTKAPALLQSVAPEYPAAALAAGKTAAVKVRLHIDAVGIVTRVDVVTPIGAGFDEAATAAAMQYVFDPAEIDGKAAAIVVETAINFVIETAPVIETPADKKTVAVQSSDAPPSHAGVFSSPISLSGNVLERGTRRKLSGIIVTVAELGLDAITDSNGDFFFHGLPPGHYQVIAIDQKYDRLERPVVISAREAVEVRMWLRPLGGNPYESLVEGTRDSLEVTKRSLSREQLTSVPGTFGDPIRVIQSLPGLARAPFGLGLLLIRGSNPDDTGVFLDGHEVPLLFHFLGGPSILNPDMVGGLDLYPGGFPARFGRRHGGVVSVDTRPSESDGVHGEANINLLDSSAYVRAPITKRLSIAVAGRRSYLDTFLGYVLPDPGPGQTQTVVPVYYDWQARLDWRPKNAGRLSVFAIGSGDSLRVLSSNESAMQSSDLSTAIKFFRVIATYTQPAGRDVNLTLSPAFGRDTVTIAGAQAEASGPFTSISALQTTLSYRMRLAGKINSWLTIDTGLDVQSRVNEYRAKIPLTDDLANASGIDVAPESVTQSATLHGAALYGDVGIRPTSRLRIVPSLRLDAFLISGQRRFSYDPRLVGRYQLDHAWTVKSYVGKFSQPPQAEALDIRFGNPKLNLETGYHFGAGFEWRPSRLWLLDSEAYYIRRRDLVVFSTDIEQQNSGNFVRQFWSNAATNYAYGVEGIIRREISQRVFGWLSYTFLVARQQRGPDKPETPTTFDQMHTLNAVVSYKPGGGWELGARFRMSTGRPGTPVTSATYDADNGSYNPVLGVIRSERLPLFSQLDLRAEKTWLFETWSFAAFLDVQNVYNAKNIEAVRYDYRYRNQAPVTGVPVLPTIGVKGRW